MKETVRRLLPNLVCPACRKKLTESGQQFTCANCRKIYYVDSDILCFTDRLQDMTEPGRNDSFTLRVKGALKRHPKLFRAVHAWIAGPSLGTTPRKFAEQIGHERVILNLGSGTSDLGPDVVNIDCYAYPNVDLTADIHALPFADASVDAVISQSVLEHLDNPERSVAEITRVLKPGGLVYVQTPFLHAYHASPRDYRRWTAEGLEHLFPGFSRVESGVIYGPTSSLVHTLSEWLGLTLSFGIRKLHQALNMGFQILLGPLRLFDLLLARHPESADASHIIFYVGQKEN